MPMILLTVAMFPLCYIFKVDIRKNISLIACFRYIVNEIFAVLQQRRVKISRHNHL